MTLFLTLTPTIQTLNFCLCYVGPSTVLM